MDDIALLRYSRHLLLDEIGIEGQARISSTSVLVVGAGGLGSPAAMYLAAAGVGRLVVLDDDVVELGNLQRQILYTTPHIGQPKTDAAALALGALNPDVRIETQRLRLDAGNALGLLRGIDVALDCSDNRATRYALNGACVEAEVPLVAAAASRFSGQLAVFDLRRADAPCYACLFPPAQGEDERCATTGIFAPLAGAVGVLQAGEALRLVCGFGEPATGQLLLVDALEPAFERLRVARDPHCPVCASRPSR